MPWLLMVTEHFDASGEFNPAQQGRFDEPEAALAACREVIDSWLLFRIRPDVKITSDDLWDGWKKYGETPALRSEGVPSLDFDAAAFARKRCIELLGPLSESQ